MKTTTGFLKAIYRFSETDQDYINNLNIFL